jgi:undecaprenyl-phosphate glucose phosphotransferase
MNFTSRLEYGLKAMSFEQFGTIRQHSAFLVRVGRLLDGMIIFSSLYFAVQVTGETWGKNYLIIALLSILIFETIASFFELYRSWRTVRLRHELFKLLLYWTLCVFIILCLLWTFDEYISVSSSVIFGWFLTAFVVISFARYCIRIVMRYLRAYGYDTRRIAFVGANDTIVRLKHTFDSHPWMGMNIMGVFDDRAPGEGRDVAVAGHELAGGLDDLHVLAKRGLVDIVYIGLPLAAENRIKTMMDKLSDTTVSICYCPSFFSFDLMNARWDDVFGQPVITVLESPFIGHTGFLKRLEDLVLVALVTPVLFLPMLVIAILVKLSSSGPVLYKQSRYGLDGKAFMMWKFRTMYADDCEDQYSQVKKNDPRITGLGSFLRKTSLDELPQIFNVLLGSMSVVGPRPHPDVVNEELRDRIHRYMMRHKIKPGITGWAQVNGFRGETETLEKMEKRIEYDLEYIRNWSVWLDVLILFKTVFSLAGDKVY